jgi:hypothetical protein
MSWLRDHKWWGLYLLAPLSAGLLYLDGDIHANLRMHEFLAMAAVVILCGLALFWTERHADIVESEGVDAWSPADFYRSSGTFIAGPTVLTIPVGRPRYSASASPRPSNRELHQPDVLPVARADDVRQIAQRDVVLN